MRPSQSGIIRTPLTALSTQQRAWSGPELGACVVLSHLLLVIIKKQLDLGRKI